METSNILRGQTSPGHSSWQEHLRPGCEPRGGSAEGPPLHTHERPRRPGGTLPKGGSAAGKACPTPTPLAHRDCGAWAWCLPPPSNPISWKQEAILDHPQGCHQARGLLGCEHPRPGLKGPTRVQCPSCVHLQGGSMSAWPSTVSAHRREPRLANTSSEQAENHCAFPEESKGLKGCRQNTPSAVTQTPSWPRVACGKTKVRSTWAGHF